METRYARDYPGAVPSRILGSAQHHFDAPVHDTNDTEFWFKQTQRLNDQYLSGSGDENALAQNGPDSASPASASTPSLAPHPPRRFVPAGLPSFFVPTSGTEDWRRLLAAPDRHWRGGYSAKTLAERWEGTKGFPGQVVAVLAASPVFRDIEFLCGFPEYKVPLPGGERASQNDIMVLARTRESLVSIAVEGKVDESFGDLLADWAADASDGKVLRLQFLLDTLGLPATIPGAIRYQLLHRATSAVITAKRFHARRAVLLVHSFSSANSGFGDYAAFLHLYGEKAEPDTVVTLKQLGEVTLHACWVCG